MNNDTNPNDGQQPNPGAVDGAVTTDAAKPNEQPATVPPVVDGQGDGGDKTGGDAGKDGVKDGTADGKSGDGQDKTKDEQPVLTGAPEAYADYTMPEGFVLDGERKSVAESFFREANMSQAGAQRAIDLFTKLVGEDAAVQQQAMEAAVAQQRDDWGKQAKAQLGDQYDAKVKLATTAVHSLQNPELIKAFDELGWGNHPELIKVFAMLGEMQRDSPVDGIGNSGSAAKKAAPWERMYEGKM